MIKFWYKFNIQIHWYNSTRCNSFPLSPLHSLSGKKEKLSRSASRHNNNNLSVYIFLDSDLYLGKSKGFNNKRIKVQVKFISPECFLNFSSNLYIPPWLRKSFTFMVLILQEDKLQVKKLNLFILVHVLKQNSPLGRKKLTISPEQHFLKIYLSPSEKGRGLRGWKWPKLKLAKVLDRSFDKIPPSLLPLHLWLLFCRSII